MQLLGTNTVGPAGGAGVLGDDVDAWRQNSIRRLTHGTRLLVGSTWQQLSKAFRFFSTPIFLSIWHFVCSLKCQN